MTKVENAYSAMVERKLKPGQMISEAMTSHKAAIAHCAMGVAGEAGELLDAIKKHVIYGKPLDLENVVEELGDLEFYMEGLRAQLQLQRENILVANMAKLDARYKGNYTDDEAIARKDKA